jgi:hypothetical protein
VNWGAENRDGSSGANISSAPFDIFSKATGTWHSDAMLTSDQTPGTTIAPLPITVTP